MGGLARSAKSAGAHMMLHTALTPASTSASLCRDLLLSSSNGVNVSPMSLIPFRYSTETSSTPASPFLYYHPYELSVG